MWMTLALENLSSCRKVLKLSQERLTIKMFRPLRRSVKGVAFEIHHLLKKVDENFVIRKRERTEDARPARERQAANLLLTNNANCLQAQPASFPGKYSPIAAPPSLSVRKKCTALLQNVYIFSLFLFKKYCYNHKRISKSPRKTGKNAVFSSFLPQIA